MAEAMVANMIANQENPDFWKEHDRIQEEAAHKVLQLRKEREEQEQQEK